MTIKEKLHEMLTALGMFPHQADEVIERLIARPASDPMKGRWDEDTSGYPTSLLTAIWVATRQEAVAWIDEKKPKAWFRSMFAGDAEQPTQQILDSSDDLMGLA